MTAPPGARQDMFRSGVRDIVRRDNHFDGKILYYVMSHYPGQATSSWRRLFYGALAHGMKTLDLYEFHSSWHATENYVDVEGGSYENVLSAMWELGQLDDIIMAGVEQGAGARTAVLFGRTADIWQQVRKPPSWPRSWADLSLLSLHTRRNVWANLHLLGRPDALARSEALVPGVLTQVQPRAVESFRRRFVYFTSNSPYRIYQAAPE